MNNFITFFIDKNLYALDSEKIIEIIRPQEIYPLPFVPQAILGAIDYEGKIYSVLDGLFLISNFVDIEVAKKSKSVVHTLLVLKHNEEDICISIDKVQSLLKAQLLTSSEEEKSFLGIIEVEENKIPVLDVEEIVRIERNCLGYK